MAHNFRVIQSCSDFGRNGEPRYFAVCLEWDIDTGACFVSPVVATALFAFMQGLIHQKKERSTLTYR